MVPALAVRAAEAVVAREEVCVAGDQVQVRPAIVSALVAGQGFPTRQAFRAFRFPAQSAAGK